MTKTIEKVGMISLGCAKNLVNSEQMMWLLSNAGYHVSGDTDNADIIVINTCGFIEDAKTEAIETILEVAEGINRSGQSTEIPESNRNGQQCNKTLIVIGCLPERYKKEILEEIPEIDAVAGTGSFDDIVSIVKNAVKSKKTGKKVSEFEDINAPVSETKRIISTSPVWAYLKIAEGCDNCCAYCSIPSIRGKLRSRPLELIVKEAQSLAVRGYKELILVAQDTTAYGTDLYGKRSLTKLLRSLGGINGLKWLRILYMYPDGFDDELVDEIANNDKIVKYLDIPLQHINDGILKKMNRRAGSEDIRRLIEHLRKRIPQVVLRTSFITGLPGEGEREFTQLHNFLRETAFERAGVFAYSPEEGTKAAKMKYADSGVAAERAQILLEQQSKIMKQYSLNRVGTVTQVLIEGYGSESKKPVLLSRSYAEAPEADGYIMINNGKPHTFADVKLTGTKDGQPIGELI